MNRILTIIHMHNSPWMLEEPPVEYNWLCCTAYKDRARFLSVLPSLELSPVQKRMFVARYVSILENFQKRARNHAIVFFVGHFIITVGSLFVPALLSIQNSDKSYVFNSGSFTVNVYWATFIISLLVTIFNGILTLFKIDKKYYFLHTTLERLRSEGWQYVGLTGRYSGHLLGPDIEPTHDNQFLYFSHYIEKIKMKQVEEEYYKTDEKSAHTPAAGGNGSGGNGSTAAGGGAGGPGGLNAKSELYPPSPDHPVTAAVIQQNAPEPMKQALSSLLRSQSFHSRSHMSHSSSAATATSRSASISSSPKITPNPLARLPSSEDLESGLGLFAPRQTPAKEDIPVTPQNTG